MSTPSLFFSKEPGTQAAKELSAKPAQGPISRTRFRGHHGFLNRTAWLNGLFLPISLVMVVAGALLFDPAEDFLVDSALHNVSSSSAFASVVQGMVPAITSTMESWGYGGVFFLMLAESVSLPLPS